MPKKTYIRDGRAPVPKSDITSRVMSSNKAKNTKPELILRRVLWAQGIRGYRCNYKKVPGRPDVAFLRTKIAVFVNGCFWHRCPHCKLPLPKSNIKFWKTKFEANLKRDKMKIQLLRKAGWKVFVIWECEINNNLNKFVSEMKRLKTAD